MLIGPMGDNENRVFDKYLWAFPIHQIKNWGKGF
jgi:hypothetical protein